MPKRVSDAEKKRRETFRRDRQREVLPIRPGVPDPPTWLSPAALEVWRELEPTLAEVGHVCDLDREVLGVFCAAAADVRMLREVIDRGGMVSGGKVRPEVAILARAEKRVLEAANALGLSPGARARLGVTLPDPEPPEEEVDPLEKIIRENQARLAQTMGSGHNL